MNVALIASSLIQELALKNICYAKPKTTFLYQVQTILNGANTTKLLAIHKGHISEARKVNCH